jgi:hypothetical protein
LTPASKNGEKSLAVIDTLSESQCNHLAQIAEIYSNGGTDQQGYDTTRAYLTLCYNQQGSVGYFTLTDGDNDHRKNDLNRYVEYREWLKSVLYLRTDSTWYCRDVESILGTFKYYEGHGAYPNGAIAGLRYILDNRKCDSAIFTPFIQGNINWRNEIWKDSVKDSLHSARPDTTIPSIDDIGLSILRGQQASVRPVMASRDEYLGDLYVTENPFTRSTEVKVTVYEYGLVTFQLFDALGKEQTSNGIGQVLQPGEHTFEIDGNKIASGVYFARLSYHNGDVKTVMLRKK